MGVRAITKDGHVSTREPLKYIAGAAEERGNDTRERNRELGTLRTRQQGGEQAKVLGTARGNGRRPGTP